MLNIMRSDPYARLMSLVDRYQRSKNSFSPWEEALIDGLRGEIPVLMEARARRLSDEASALPPVSYELRIPLLVVMSRPISAHIYLMFNHVSDTLSCTHTTDISLTHWLHCCNRKHPT